MRYSISAFTAVLLLATPALAVQRPDFTPTRPETDYHMQARFKTEPVAPYSMNYTDEVAASLGVVGGKADFVDTGRSESAFVPSLKGGVDRGGAMFRLQWHPGE
jgi:hypothetical protein